MGVAGATSFRRSAATERRAAEGVTMTTASAPSQAAAYSAVARMAEGRR